MTTIADARGAYHEVSPRYKILPGAKKVSIPDIIVGLPCGDRLCTQTKSDLTLQSIVCRHRIYKEMDSAGTYLSDTHNTLVRMCLYDPGASKILFTDSDMRFPPDALLRLDEHDLDVVGCTYMRRRDGKPLIYRLPGHEGPPADLEEWEKIPSGFMMVKTKVFRKMTWPWFFETYGEGPEDFVGTDENFCLKAREFGFKVWCDLKLSREIRHLAERELEFQWPE